MHNLSLLDRRNSPRYKRFFNDDEFNMRMDSSSVFDSPFVEHFNREPWSSTHTMRRSRIPDSGYNRPRPTREHQSGIDDLFDFGSQRRVLNLFNRQFDGNFGFQRLNEENSSARIRNSGFDDSRARVIPIQVIREPRREFSEIQGRPIPRFIGEGEVYISDDSDCDEPEYIGPNDNNNGLRNLWSSRRTPPGRRGTNQGRVDSHIERSRNPVTDRPKLTYPTVLQIDSSTTNVQPSSSRSLPKCTASRQHSTPTTASTIASVKKQIPVQHIESTPGYPLYAYLKSKLESDGRQVDYIQGDGNCFFRALSKEIYEQEEFHAEVRQAVMDVIQKYPTKFEQFLDDDETMKEHIKDMRLPSTWSTTMEIYGAATLLQRDIFVLSPNHTGETYNWLLFSPRFTYNGNMKYHPCYITLCHTNGNHYDRIAAKRHECNCNVNAPKLSGAECYVDLTDAELSVC